jgi:hypothetical protein
MENEEMSKADLIAMLVSIREVVALERARLLP